MAERRQGWLFWRAHLDPRRLVFLDETSANTKMARRYRRAFRSERLVSKVPHGHCKTMTFLAGLTLNGFIAPLVVDGAMNGRVFRAYVEQQLCKAPTKAISSSWIIWPLTKYTACERRSNPQGPSSNTCPHTALISIQSSFHSRSSRRYFVRLLLERYPTWNRSSQAFSTVSGRANAKTTFATAGTRYDETKSALVLAGRGLLTSVSILLGGT